MIEALDAPAQAAGWFSIWRRTAFGDLFAVAENDGGFHISRPTPIADGAVLGPQRALDAAGAAGAQVRPRTRAAQAVAVLRVALGVQVPRIRGRRALQERRRQWHLFRAPDGTTTLKRLPRLGVLPAHNAGRCAHRGTTRHGRSLPESTRACTAIALAHTPGKRAAAHRWCSTKLPRKQSTSVSDSGRRSGSAGATLCSSTPSDASSSATTIAAIIREAGRRAGGTPEPVVSRTMLRAHSRNLDASRAGCAQR